jgi:hypothetical protein
MNEPCCFIFVDDLADERNFSFHTHSFISRLVKMEEKSAIVHATLALGADVLGV